jgi:hypothetical protein
LEVLEGGGARLEGGREDKAGWAGGRAGGLKGVIEGWVGGIDREGGVI